jgi:hypothetical protein
MKNRMREIRSTGSVRGGGGNVPTYSAAGVVADRELSRTVADDHGVIDEASVAQRAPQHAFRCDPQRVVGGPVGGVDAARGGEALPGGLCAEHQLVCIG